MQSLKFSVPTLSFALALAIGLPAAAQSPGTTPQSGSPSSQTAPAPPPAVQQNGPAGSNQSSQQSQANQSQANQSQANEDNPLNLTEEQKTKLRPIIMEENQQMEALRNDNSMTQDQKIAKANQIRADASPKIKAILTPEQLQKLSQMQQERVRQQQQQQQSQPAPPSNSQPPPK
jgi:Spy/CpxP family protein refolding chaperone